MQSLLYSIPRPHALHRSPLSLCYTVTHAGYWAKATETSCLMGWSQIAQLALARRARTATGSGNATAQSHQQQLFCTVLVVSFRSTNCSSSAQASWSESKPGPQLWKGLSRRRDTCAQGSAAMCQGLLDIGKHIPWEHLGKVATCRRMLRGHACSLARGVSRWQPMTLRVTSEVRLETRCCTPLSVTCMRTDTAQYSLSAYKEEPKPSPNPTMEPAFLAPAKEISSCIAVKQPSQSTCAACRLMPLHETHESVRARLPAVQQVLALDCHDHYYMTTNFFHTRARLPAVRKVHEVQCQ